MRIQLRRQFFGLLIGRLHPSANWDKSVGELFMITTAPITIQVSEEAAKAFAQVSPEEKQKIQLLLDLRLRDLTGSSRKSLGSLMDEIGSKAETRGLTPAILESLLKND